MRLGLKHEEDGRARTEGRKIFFDRGAKDPEIAARIRQEKAVGVALAALDVVGGLAGVFEELLLHALVEIELTLGENVLGLFVEDEHAHRRLVRPRVGVHLKLGVAIRPALGDELIHFAADVFELCQLGIGEVAFIRAAHEAGVPVRSDPARPWHSAGHGAGEIRADTGCFAIRPASRHQRSAPSGFGRWPAR